MWTLIVKTMYVNIRNYLGEKTLKKKKNSPCARSRRWAKRPVAQRLSSTHGEEDLRPAPCCDSRRRGPSPRAVNGRQDPRGVRPSSPSATMGAQGEHHFAMGFFFGAGRTLFSPCAFSRRWAKMMFAHSFFIAVRFA